jgi:hypothetical protein
VANSELMETVRPMTDGSQELAAPDAFTVACVRAE